jgi:CMP-N,N'-diacetyllegionaminic acid synthase
MLGGHRVLALIPARGGSKTVPRKNLRSLGGKPLLAWPIQVAQQTPEVDQVIVSTDDAEIAAVATSFGAAIHHRPPELAADTSLVVDAVRHLKSQLAERAAIVTLLEATAPFRTPAMISRCLQRLVAEDLDSIATFSETDINPQRVWRIEAGMPAPYIEGAVPWMPRQSFAPAYRLNAAVYAFRFDRLPETGPSILFGRIGAEILPGDTLVDIDTERDFMVANAILESSQRS